MKNTLVTLLAVAALSLSANAQEKNGMKGRHHHQYHHARMAKQLNFSDDQKKQTKLLNDDFRNKMRELNKNESITVKEMRDRKESFRKERTSKINGLLTAQQKDKLAQQKAIQQLKANQRFTLHLAKMKANLNLSEAQVDKLTSQREANRLKMKSIRDNNTLSRETRKEQMLAIKSNAKEQRKKIFTEEQLKKIEEARKKHNNKQSVK